MKLNELSNNPAILEETLRYFIKIEETEDGYITWSDWRGIPQLQINTYNNIIYILSDDFRMVLEEVQKRRSIKEEEQRKSSDPFYLNKEKKGEPFLSSQADVDRRKAEYAQAQKAKKEQERLHISDRLNVDYLIDTAEFLDDYQRDILTNASNRGFVSKQHMLRECEPEYIDKYTTAYNSEIMRAILSHQ
jgi:hypothetical protein